MKAEDAQGDNFVIFIVFHYEHEYPGSNKFWLQWQILVSDKFMSKGIAVPYTPPTITNIFGPLPTRGPL